MSNNFKEIINSSYFLNAYGFNDKGICYVEDESDIPFWEYLLNKHLSGKFDIKTASSTKNPHARGKKVLLEKIPNLYDKHIIAMDSDFDYIFGDKNNNTLENKYILHTFFYSRESLLYRSDRLDLISKYVKYNLNHDLKPSLFLNQFSKKCYEALINVAYLVEIGAIDNSYLKIKVNEIINIGNDKKFIYNEDLILNYSILNKIDSKLSEFILENNSFLDQSKINKFKIEKKSLGLDEYSAYQYIDGHLLENYINHIFKILVNHLKKIESKRIVNESINVCSKNREKHIESQKDKVDNHFKIRCNYSTLIENLLSEDFSNICYERIVKRIISIGVV